MSAQLSKTKRILAIFFSTLAVMADLVITPVIGMIYGYYPDNMSAVNYIVSGPMLVLVIVSLLTPYLTRHMDKKVVFTGATVIFSIGAIFGVAVETPCLSASPAPWWASAKVLSTPSACPTLQISTRTPRTATGFPDPERSTPPGGQSQRWRRQSFSLLPPLRHR